MTNGNRVLVKIFIDGQNFYNRVKDFDLHVAAIDYPSFFDYIISQIKPNFSELYDVKLLKAEWYVTGTLNRQYPWRKMKYKYFSPYFKNSKDPEFKKLLKLKTNHPDFDENYKKIFDTKRFKDNLLANNYNRKLKRHIKSLTKIRDRYHGHGITMDDEQLDLIYIKFCGFLKMNFEQRSANEKGVDVAIASQMLSSILDTSNLQQKIDIDDVIPDYNSDVIVLISTDMDFIEPLRILHTMGKTVYTVHIQKRLIPDLPTKGLCHPILINKSQMSSFVRNN